MTLSARIGCKLRRTLATGQAFALRLVHRVRPRGGRECGNDWAAGYARLNEASGRLASIDELEGLRRRIVLEARRVIPCDAAVLYSVSQPEEGLILTAACGLSEGELQDMGDAKWEEMPPRLREARELDPACTGLHGEDVETQLGPYRSAKGMRMALWLPLVLSGRQLGLIGLGATRVDGFGPLEVDLARQYSKYAVTALANEEIYHELKSQLQSKTRDLTNLSKIGQAVGGSLQTSAVLASIVRAAVEAFQSSGSSIILLDDEQGDLLVAAAYGHGTAGAGLRLPIADSAAGWVIRHGKALYVPHLLESEFAPLRSFADREGVESYIGVPLRVRGTPIGILAVYWRSHRQLGAGDVDLLQGMAAQATIAIEHARLYEAVAHERAKLQAIMDSVNEGLLVVNPAGKLAYYNQGLADILGIDEQLSGIEHIDKLWDWVLGHAMDPIAARENLSLLVSEHARAIAIALDRPSRQVLEIQGFDVDSARNNVLGRGYVVRDISQQAAVERLKSSILMAVSHELRTPLTAIKGFATTLLRKDIEWDPPSRREFLQQIDQEADRLEEMVHNLLDMSRLEDRPSRLDREWCDISQLVRDTLERMPPFLVEHRVRVISEKPTVPAFVNRVYLERVICNLVENSAKYSEAGTTITVEVAGTEQNVLLKVRDEGVGIRPDEREHIFERFYRGTSGRLRRGIGIGLAICQRIVEAHGGTITVDSPPGCGSVFSVVLPVPQEEETV